MWCSTARMPPSSSPPPARPGPPCTSIGRGEPCPVDSLASSASSTSIRPCHGAAPSTTSRANSASPVTTDPTRLPCPRAASSTTCSAEVYGSSVDTGPNASTSCGSARCGSSALSSTGDRNAPRSASAPTTSTWSGSPNTMRPASLSAFSERRTSSRCSRLASAPMRTSGFEGSPTLMRARRSHTASCTSSSSSAGTKARRMAVHFCPAFTVISVTSCLT